MLGLVFKTSVGHLVPQVGSTPTSFRHQMTIQIFGLRSSQPARAAERFFKERRIPIQLVDLAQRPMAPGEIRRFIDKFTLRGLLDEHGKSYESAGLKYLKLSDAELIAKIENDPKLLRLPLVRAGTALSIGPDQDAWKQMAASATP